MKGQVLADFVVEVFPRREAEIVFHVKIQPWRVFVVSASSALGVGAGIIIITQEGIKLEHFFRLGFKVSNNKVEYEALLARLQAVLNLGAQKVEVYSDSRLVVNQVQGSFEAKNP